MVREKMVDSAPDPKVEDVLSSVRRLVSQEIPRRHSKPINPDAEALVLTSAQRIKGRVKSRRSVSVTLEQRIAKLEAAVDEGGLEEFEPDGSEDQALHRPDRIVYTRPRTSDAGETAGRSTLRLSEIALIETGSSKDESDSGDAPLEFRRDAADTDAKPSDAEAPMAKDVPTLPTNRGEVKHFVDPDDVVDRIESRIGEDEYGRSIVSVPLNLMSLNQTDAESEYSEEEIDAALKGAVRKSIEETAPEGDMNDQAEDADLNQNNYAEEDWDAPVDAAPDVAGVDETPSGAVKEVEAEMLQATEQPTEVDTVEELRSETENESADGSTPNNTADVAKDAADAATAALDALPDEDAMRILVGRLIRQELQGELGQRITHNVRKLVRREVNRAMTEQDLI